MSNRFSRRDFLQYAGLLSASMMLPGFLKVSDKSLVEFNGKKLVIIQLTGGNDGLNTIIPYSNDLYYSNRPDIGVKQGDLIILNDDLAFNPALEGFTDLWEKGSMSVLNSVGYPNPNRSHFRSRDIWHSASDENITLTTGWVARAFDSKCTDDNCALPHNAIEIDSSLSLVFRGEKFNGLAMDKPSELAPGLHNSVIEAFSTLNESKVINNHDFLYKEMIDTYHSADYVISKSKVYNTTIAYPTSEFSRRLKTIAQLINGGSETQVYYASLPGFDTHVQQNAFHPKQLRMLAEGLNAFYQDLKLGNEWNNTVVMVYSEFGRRLKQNGARGTDHGTGNNVLFFGGSLNKLGILNDPVNLTDLEDGDIKHTIDFRSVYATLLKRWLNMEPSVVLGKEFPILDYLV